MSVTVYQAAGYETATPTAVSGQVARATGVGLGTADGGDVGFALEVGAIGVADYDATKSPFGFHVIQRVK